MFRRATRRRPSTGAFQIAVRTPCPRHVTSRGRPTLTDMSRPAAIVPSLLHAGGVTRAPAWSTAPHAHPARRRLSGPHAPRPRGPRAVARRPGGRRPAGPADLPRLLVPQGAGVLPAPGRPPGRCGGGLHRDGVAERRPARRGGGVSRGARRALDVPLRRRARAPRRAGPGRDDGHAAPALPADGLRAAPGPDRPQRVRRLLV